MDSSVGGQLFLTAAEQLGRLTTLETGRYGALKAAGERDRAWLTSGGEVIVEQLLPKPDGPGDTWQRTDCAIAFSRAMTTAAPDVMVVYPDHAVWY